MGCGMSTLDPNQQGKKGYGKKTLQEMSDHEREVFYRHLQLYAQLRQ